MGWMEDGYDWLVSRNRVLNMRRRVLFASPDRLGVAQDFESQGEHHSVLATAHYWFASLVTVHEGSLGFRDGYGTRRMESPRFLLYLPAGSLVRMPLCSARVQTRGITARVRPAGWPEVPVAVPCELTEEEALSEGALSAVLRSIPHKDCRIDAERGVDASTRALRRRLYERALGPAPVGRIALERAMAPAVLSRTFSGAFGLSPREYCQRVRVHAAAVSLLGGLSIVQVALDSGWQDLSRFYRQFRRATGQTPGRYRAAGGFGQSVK